jgi:hypothetical protein
MIKVSSLLVYGQRGYEVHLRPKSQGKRYHFDFLIDMIFLPTLV